MDEGDRVLIMPSLGENIAIPVESPGIGDTVMIYSLRDETRIAVPALTLSPGSRIFNTPSFNFGGFNWSINFNFQLIPLVLNLAAGVYGLNAVLEYSMPNGSPAYNSNLLTSTPSYNSSTMMGDQGWFIAKWVDGVHLREVDTVEIWEATSPNHHSKLEINPNGYIYPKYYLWKPLVDSESYRISFIYPNRVRILCIGSYSGQGPDVGHITGCVIRI